MPTQVPAATVSVPGPHVTTLDEGALGARAVVSAQATDARAPGIDRLSSVPTALVPQVTSYLDPIDISSLAATSHTVRRGVLAHQPNATLLEAWQRWELYWRGPDRTHNDEVDEALVQANAARLGRTAVDVNEYSAAWDAIDTALTRLVLALSARDVPVARRMQEACDLIARMKPHFAAIESRVQSVDTDFGAFAHSADDHDALRQSVDEMMRSSPPTILLPYLKQADAALHWWEANMRPLMNRETSQEDLDSVD